MGTNQYEEMMNSGDVTIITNHNKDNLVKGTLIGFKGLGNDMGITASYPLYRVSGNEIVFVLYECSKTGRPVLDNTFINSPYPAYVNIEPIVVEVSNKSTSTFNDELSDFFNANK